MFSIISTCKWNKITRSPSVMLMNITNASKITLQSTFYKVLYKITLQSNFEIQ